jgi:integrase
MLNDFQNYLKLNIDSINGRIQYWHRMKLFFKSQTEFNQKTINKFLANCVDQKLKPSTFNGYMTAVKHYARFLKLEIEFPKQKQPTKGKKDFLTLKELEEELFPYFNILFPNDCERRKWIVRLMFTSGLRPCEVVNLKKEDLNFEEQYILVKDTKDKEDRKTFLESSLTPFLKQEIANSQTDYIFNITQGYIKYIFKKINDELHYKKHVNPYLLRHCVSSDTEILTINGWKKYNELKKGDLHFSFNIITNKIEIIPLQDINIYNYNNKIYQVKSRDIDLLMTPEHKSFCSILLNHGSKYGYERLSWQLKPIEEIINFKAFFSWRALLSGKTTGIKKINNYFTSILGWILTDGHIAHKKYGCDITISQSLSANAKKCAILEEHLIKSKLYFTKNIQKEKIGGYTKRPHQMIIFRIRTKSHKKIFKWLNKNNTPKNELLLLSYNNLKYLFNSMMLADGCRGNEFCDQNPINIEFLRIIANLINYHTNYKFQKKHRTYIHHKNYCTLYKKHIKLIDYNGVVWCPQNKNQTWIAKRNNKISITGNSFAHHAIKNGISIKELQEAMGHWCIKMTEEYLTLTDDEVIDSFKKKFKFKIGKQKGK